jgi:hypothetical protein
MAGCVCGSGVLRRVSEDALALLLASVFVGVSRLRSFIGMSQEG